MNLKMVRRTPHPGPLPIGSADSADAEREKRSQRPDTGIGRVVEGFEDGECGTGENG
jgi:hypothetical protein